MGVGGYVVQLAAALGGHVTATGRAADGDFILGLGAERFADAATAPSDGDSPSQAVLHTSDENGVLATRAGQS